MNTVNSFAAAVHRLRRARGLSLGAVATKSGLSQSYLSKMLHGHRSLPLMTVGRIDEFLEAGGELVRIAQEQSGGGLALPQPRQLPPAAADFVGREEYLHRMDKALIEQDRPGAVVTAVIEGGFWVGKTELALQWAARVQERFPGGCLFADLRGRALGPPADPSEVLDGFLRALGAGPDALHGSLQDRAAWYRSLLVRQPAVVVLDNIASYDQVQHLLPGAGSAVVLTSRERQAALLGARGGLRIELPPLTRDEALELLRRRVGEARVGADPLSAETVIRRCGCLPMAVRIAAEHVQQRRYRTLEYLAGELATAARRLDPFISADPAVSIHTAIDVSYLALPPLAARVFRLLGISPAYLVSPESTAALTGLDLARVQRALDVLYGAHLLDDAPAGRMRMNRLLRAYAAQRAVVEESLSEVERARDRVLRWYTATAWAASNALAANWSEAGLTPENTTEVVPITFAENDYDAAMAWCDAEVETAIHVARHARSYTASDAVWMLPAMFLPYFHLTKNWSSWLAAATEGLTAARAARNQAGIARCTQSLGWVLNELGRMAEGAEHLREAIRLQTEIGDDRARAWSEFGLASTHTAFNRHSDACEAYLRAEELFAAAGVDLGVAVTRAMLSDTYQALGKTGDASSCAHDALARAQKLSSKPVTGLAHHRLGLVLLHQQQYRPALTHFDAALALRRASRERWGEAETLIARAEALSNLRDPRGARDSYEAAASIFETLRDPRALEVQAHVVTLNACLGPHGDTTA
ncbi:helix-turn-helix domain-containing protein [Amycolatopsis aidingensis]|uniref:helix-turn-helix domain-containing protein n=1 Tax=Amycolatopsis aidingensis TaxID=2842453 RepID=UPI001C0E093B|nr:helix-turn-helix domain-containing protein [Amycolatopsis aidingensis]